MMAEEQIDALADACRKAKIGVMELLDVGLCRLNVEELILQENGRGEAVLSYPTLTDAAQTAKIIDRYLREMPMEDRAGVLLFLLRAMVVNLLGGCGKNIH